MKRLLYPAVTALLLLSWACSDEQDHKKGAIRIPDSAELNQTLYADQLTGYINIQADAYWIAKALESTGGTAPAMWVTVPYSGQAGTHKVPFSLTINGTGADRTAAILFTCNGTTQAVNITQTAMNRDGSEPAIPGIPSPSAKLVKKITKTMEERSTEKLLYEETTTYFFRYDATRRVNIISYEFSNSEQNSQSGVMELKYHGYEIELKGSYSYSHESPYYNPVIYNKYKTSTRSDSGETDTGTRADDVQGGGNFKMMYILNADGYVTASKGTLSDWWNNPDRAAHYDIQTTVSYDDGYLADSYYNQLLAPDMDEYYCTATIGWSGNNMTGAQGMGILPQGTAQYNESPPNTDAVNLDLNWMVYYDTNFSYAGDRIGMLDVLGFYGKRSQNMVSSSQTRWQNGEISGDTKYYYSKDNDGLINKIRVQYTTNPPYVYTIEYY